MIPGIGTSPVLYKKSGQAEAQEKAANTASLLCLLQAHGLSFCCVFSIMTCDLEVEDEINPFLLEVVWVKGFCHNSGKHARTVTVPACECTVFHKEQCEQHFILQTLEQILENYSVSLQNGAYQINSSAKIAKNFGGNKKVSEGT